MLHFCITAVSVRKNCAIFHNVQSFKFAHRSEAGLPTIAMQNKMAKIKKMNSVGEIVSKKIRKYLFANVIQNNNLQHRKDSDYLIFVQ